MILSKQIHFIGDSIAAKREVLQQSAAELRRMREETARELAAVIARSDELDTASVGAVVTDMDPDPVSQDADAQPAQTV
jgi:hypothetical protein